MNPFAGLAEPPCFRPGEVEKRRIRTQGSRPRPGWLAPVANPWGLSGMQYEILKHISSGKTAKEVSIQVGQSQKTVEKNLQRARDKMKARNRVHAVAMWVRHAVGGNAE